MIVYKKKEASKISIFENNVNRVNWWIITALKLINVDVLMFPI